MLTPPPFCLKKSAGDVGLFRVSPALHLSEMEWTSPSTGTIKRVTSPEINHPTAPALGI